MCTFLKYDCSIKFLSFVSTGHWIGRPLIKGTEVETPQIKESIEGAVASDHITDDKNPLERTVVCSAPEKNRGTTSELDDDSQVYVWPSYIFSAHKYLLAALCSTISQHSSVMGYVILVYFSPALVCGYECLSVWQKSRWGKIKEESRWWNGKDGKTRWKQEKNCPGATSKICIIWVMQILEPLFYIDQMWHHTVHNQMIKWWTAIP